MTYDQRLPAVSGDDGQWGNILNQFLMLQHVNTGVNNPTNGGHQVVTITAGTTAANTAPLTFTSGPLMTTPQTGSIEFLTDRLYFTQTTSTTRKVLAAFDDSSGATGDTYYRDSGGNFVRLGVGTTGQVMSVASGVPAWSTPATALLPWTEVTGTSQTAAINNGYIANNAGMVTITLPATAAQGSVIEVVGKGAGGWLIGQPSGVTTYFGIATTTAGTGGSLGSNLRRDSVKLVCITANTEWEVTAAVGNIDVN